MPSADNVRDYLCPCGQPGYARGLCRRCYGRVQRNGDTVLRTARGLSAAQHLARYSERTEDGCLLWTGATYDSGYGAIRRGDTDHKAHRLAYQTHVGDLPDDVGLDHLCHSRAVAAGTCAGGACVHRRCLEPTHLEPVPQAVNWKRGVIGASDRCKHGHLYDRTASIKGGKYTRRVCSTCARASDARRRT